MTNNSIEISLRGKWQNVPALQLNGVSIIAQGGWLKTAVVHDEEWIEAELSDPETCIAKLKDKQASDLRADVFTFTQKVPATAPKYPYQMELDSIAAIHIASFKDWWEKLPQESRKNVRRSQKRGVEVRVRPLDSELLKVLLDLNNDSPVRQGKPFTHFGKTLEQVTKDQQAFLDRSDYVCAFAGDELIGIMKLIYRGDVASILTFLPKASQHDKRPANALMAKAVELCEEKHISYLLFGKFNYGTTRDSSLREFKIRNGFEEMLMPRYFIPLTMKGVVSLKLNLHRGLARLLPHGIISVLLKVRTKYHRFKLSRCSSTLERPNRTRQMERSIPPAGSTPSQSSLEPIERSK
jgi:hypothetical protein